MWITLIITLLLLAALLGLYSIYGILSRATFSLLFRPLVLSTLCVNRVRRVDVIAGIYARYRKSFLMATAQDINEFLTLEHVNQPVVQEICVAIADDMLAKGFLRQYRCFIEGVSLPERDKQCFFKLHYAQEANLVRYWPRDAKGNYMFEDLIPSGAVLQ